MKRLALIPLTFLAIIVGGYFVWWQITATQMEKLTLQWIEDLRDDGFQAYHGQPIVTGFPFNLEITLPAPLITAPDSRFTYKGEKLVAETRPWNPTVYRLEAIGKQTIEANQNGGTDQFDIGFDSAYAHINVTLNGTIKRIDIITNKLAVTSLNLQDGTTIEDFALNLVLPEKTADKGSDLAFTFQLTADQIALPRAIRTPFKTTIKHLSTRSSIMGPLLNAPLDRAIAYWQNSGGQIDIMDFALKWGNLQVTGNGEVALDNKLFPLMAIESEIAGLDDALLTLADKGLVDARIAKLSAIGFKLMAKAPTDVGPAKVDVPISAQGGAFYLGPLLVATLPNLKGQFANAIPDKADAAPVKGVEELELRDLEEPPRADISGANPAN